MARGYHSQMKQYVVYLLHFDRPVGPYRHYTGLARSMLLMQRMRQHGHGNGANLTKRAVSNGTALYLVRRTFVDRPHAEKAIKYRGHAKTRCPICTPSLLDAGGEGMLYRLPALPEMTWEPMKW